MHSIEKNQEQKIHLTRHKVLFCRGDGGFTQAGLSSLVHRLITKNEPEKPTTITTAIEFVGSIEIPSSPLKLDYLIAAANERFKNTMQKTTHQIKINLLVFGISIEDLLENSVDTILQIINNKLEEHAYNKLSDCKFLLAITKSDLVENHENASLIADNLIKANRIRDFSSYVICSAKTGYGCEKLEGEILRMVGLNHIQLAEDSKNNTSDKEMLLKDSKLKKGLSLNKFGLKELHHGPSDSKKQAKDICGTLDKLFPTATWTYENNKFIGYFKEKKDAQQAAHQIKDANCGILETLETLVSSSDLYTLHLEQVTQNAINRLAEYSKKDLLPEKTNCIVA